MKVLEAFRRKFSIKVFALFAGIIFIIFLSFALFFINRQATSLEEALINKGSLLAQILAYNARIGVFSENDSLLKDPVEGILEQEGVLQVTIFTIHNTLLVKRYKSKLDQFDQVANDGAALDSPVLARIKKSPDPFFTDEGRLMTFWAPVMAGAALETEESLFFGHREKTEESPIGIVGITMDKERLNLQLRDLLFKSMLLGVIFIFIGSATTFLMVRRITRPLNRLTEEVRALERGGAVREVPVETHDEVGMLAQSFNSMAETLRKREKEKGLLENQLRHAQKMEAIGTLAGGIAHDFNNILTTIVGYGHLLNLQVEENESLQYHVNQILVSAERAANLTQSLLAFSRKQLIKLQPIDLNQVITNVEKLLTRLIREDIEIKKNLAPRPLTLLADPGQIDQVMMNLVTNARDAMPHGGVITITTQAVTVNRNSFIGRNVVKPGRYALLSVSDTGSGMDEDTRKKIFDPFFTTKEVGKGTGLGLSMIYGIIKQHDGFVDVLSEKGTGTTFIIYLPLTTLEVTVTEEGRKDLPKGGTETILVAEDDTTVRNLSREVLERAGYTVILAINGEEAVLKFQEHMNSVDLVLLDVVMPKANGKEVWDKIRKIKPDSKSIFISGYTYDIIHEKGVIKDEINFIPKPISPEELLRKVRQVLDME